MNNARKGLVGTSILGAILGGGAFRATIIGAASATTNRPSTTSTSSPSDTDTTPRRRDARIQRVENDAEGSAYEAHITKLDGSRATVKIDESFTVTSTETGHGRDRALRPARHPDLSRSRGGSVQ